MAPTTAVTSVRTPRALTPAHATVAIRSLPMDSTVKVYVIKLPHPYPPSPSLYCVETNLFSHNCRCVVSLISSLPYAHFLTGEIKLHWFHTGFLVHGDGENEVCGATLPRGVRGYAPPLKFTCSEIYML